MIVQAASCFTLLPIKHLSERKDVHTPLLQVFQGKPMPAHLVAHVREEPLKMVHEDEEVSCGAHYSLKLLMKSCGTVKGKLSKKEYLVNSMLLKAYKCTRTRITHSSESKHVYTHMHTCYTGGGSRGGRAG